MSELPSPEIPMSREFISVPTDINTHTRCVDGRPAEVTKKGAQMLGGGTNPVLVELIAKNQPLTQDTLTAGIKRLEKAGYQPGFHTDDHAHGEKCGCGFCDRTAEILTMAINRLPQYQETLSKLGIDSQEAGRLIQAYDTNQLKIKGAEVIATASQIETVGVEQVQGNHDESIAFVNLVPNTTFDTNAANAARWQAFNLDLWAVSKQAESLGVSPKISEPMTLILYLATRSVLANDVPKVVVNK